jgi:cell pole-organizing protein PopZ
MSEEETAVAEDDQERSMEDILASIRRILAEDENAPAEPGIAMDPEPIRKPEPEPDPEHIPKLDPESEQITEQVSEPIHEPEPIPEPEVFFEPIPIPETVPAPPPQPAPPPPPPTMPEVMAEMLELTPDMVASEILSQPTARASVDVLSELAAKILDRRDMHVDAGSRDMTLEGIVREMLKPILREWLDRNLPYLIERLVKKEIDLMVNRAERLDLDDR